MKITNVTKMNLFSSWPTLINTRCQTNLIMEDVFSGRAHFKVLSIVHGEKEVWKRKELVKSTGISEIKLRSVLGDLVRANMILYNEEDATIRLIKRFSTLD
ncbi:MAG: hypothetical protein KAR20_08810 [Candidatus Heimdallarchaeota archaeon]|nr:hypothetical protein [Candidatus Heimdallarchaeota archaeon]